MKMGYNVMVCHLNEQYETEIKNMDALLNANVEGIIISVSRDTEKNEHIRKLKRKVVPLVIFNRIIENFKAAKVVVNDYYGVLNMVDYLIKTVCRRFAHIAGPNNLLLSNNRKAVEPALSTVKQPIYEIGETVSKLLFSQLEDPELPEELCVMETTIEVRGSSREVQQ